MLMIDIDHRDVFTYNYTCNVLNDRIIAKKEYINTQQV